MGNFSQLECGIGDIGVRGTNRHNRGIGHIMGNLRRYKMNIGGNRGHRRSTRVYGYMGIDGGHGGIIGD